MTAGLAVPGGNAFQVGAVVCLPERPRVNAVVVALFPSPRDASRFAAELAWPDQDKTEIVDVDRLQPALTAKLTVWTTGGRFVQEGDLGPNADAKGWLERHVHLLPRVQGDIRSLRFDVVPAAPVTKQKESDQLALVVR